MSDQADQISESIIQRIKDEIKSSSQTQVSIAASCGLTKQGMTNILNGHTKPSLAQLIRILDGLGLAVDLKIKKKN